jgi:hypothetical protein
VFRTRISRKPALAHHEFEDIAYSAATVACPIAIFRPAPLDLAERAAVLDRHDLDEFGQVLNCRPVVEDRLGRREPV